MIESQSYKSRCLTNDLKVNYIVFVNYMCIFSAYIHLQICLLFIKKYCFKSLLYDTASEMVNIVFQIAHALNT